MGRVAKASRKSTGGDSDQTCGSPDHRGIVVALVTRTVRQLPTEVVLGRRQGLPLRCVANLDNILTAPRQRLKGLMGACDASKIEELNGAIKAALDVP